MHSPVRAWRQAVHSYDQDFYLRDWLLPVCGQQASQLNPDNKRLDDSSLYGLHVFCCPLAVYTLGLRLGTAVLPEGAFLLQPGSHIAQFIERAPYTTFYFILCDPKRPLHLRILSLPVAQALSILRGETRLVNYVHLTREYT